MPIEQEGGGIIEIEGGGQLLQEGESALLENVWTQNLDEMFEVFGETLGYEPTVTIGAVSSIPAVIEAVPRDEIFVSGGKAQGQSFRLIIKASELDGAEVAKFSTAVTFTPPGSAISFTGAVLEMESNNGIFYVLVGDPNSIE